MRQYFYTLLYIFPRMIILDKGDALICGPFMTCIDFGALNATGKNFAILFENIVIEIIVMYNLVYSSFIKGV